MKSTAVRFVRIILSGPARSGKSVLGHMLVANYAAINGKYAMTVDVGLTERKVDGCDVLVVDTPGDPNFAFLLYGLAQTTAVDLFVFDVTSRASFQQVASIIAHVKSLVKSFTGILIGSKSDLSSRQVVSTGEAEDLAAQHRLPYATCSMKTDSQHIDAILNDAIKLYPMKI